MSRTGSLSNVYPDIRVVRSYYNNLCPLTTQRHCFLRYVRCITYRASVSLCLHDKQVFAIADWNTSLRPGRTCLPPSPAPCSAAWVIALTCPVAHSNTSRIHIHTLRTSSQRHIALSADEGHSPLHIRRLLSRRSKLVHDPTRSGIRSTLPFESTQIATHRL
jgi:hypothetical protein